MKRVVPFLLFFLLVSGIPQAHATIAEVDLSDYVSNGVEPPAEPPAVEWLFATLGFEVVFDAGEGADVLKVYVHNRTDETGGPIFNIDEFYFNVPDELDDVDGLALIGVVGEPLGKWSSGTLYSENFFNVDNFGKFDIRVANGGQHTIDPTQGTTTFTFAINGGIGPYIGDDFAYLDSNISPPEGGQQMWVTAHFVQGPLDTSGYGAVPEPATICLLGLGSLFMLTRKRRSLN